MFKLQNKIALMFIIVSLAPLMIMAVLGIYFMNLTQLNSVYNLEIQFLSQKEKEIENFINLSKGPLEIQIAAPIPSVSGMLEASRKFMLSEIIKNNKQIEEISILDFDAAYPYKENRGREITKFTRKESDVFQNDNLADYGASNGFHSALKGMIYWGEISESSGGFNVSLFVPLRNTDSVIIGVVKAVVSLETVGKLISSSAIGNNGYVYLTDKPERIIFSSKSLAINKNSPSAAAVNSTLNNQAINIFDQEAEYENHNNETVLSSSRKIKNLNLALVVEWPKADAMAIVYSSIKQSAIFGGLTILIILIVSFLFAQRIVKPIKLLETGSKIIGGGNFDYQIIVETKDELEELAEGFNSMAKNLKEVEELRQAKVRAEALRESLVKEIELSKIKDKFISTASHQLRTPISVIRWLSESLSSFDNNAKIDKAKLLISDLYKNSAQLAFIIGDMLTVSELGLNYQPKETKILDFNSLVDGELSKFIKEIDEKKLKISYEKRLKPIKIRANELAMKKVLDNLIDNALVYSRQGGSVAIELKESDKETIFSIADEGIGVPEDEQMMVWQEFFRAKNSVEMKNVGTGLGLFIVKTIIAGHGGKVGFRSVQNKGSAFWFSLPGSKDSEKI